MGYHIDLSKISIDAYKQKLVDGYLPPSRMILKENIDYRLNYFRSIGVRNLDELLRLLKKKGSIVELQTVQCLSEKYLKVLLRELKSLHPKSSKLGDFKAISKGTVKRLKEAGIKNTKKLYGQVLTARKRHEVADKLGVDEKEMLTLTKLTDLSRIKWVGATFAGILFELGIDTAEKVSQADPEILHEKINKLNKEKGYYRGTIGLNDTKILVLAAADVPFEIEY